MPFRRMVDGDFEEAKNNRIKLPDTSVTTFQIFYIWSMNPQPKVSTDLSLEAILELVIFATKYIILGLHNQAMDVLVQKMSNSVWFPRIESITRVYGEVDENSKLRKLVKLNLGGLKRAGAGAGEDWKELFLEYPELGWDFFELEVNGRRSQKYGSRACEFHEHDELSPKADLDLSWNHRCPCPYEGKEIFPEVYEEIDGLESEGWTESEDKISKKSKKRSEKRGKLSKSEAMNGIHETDQTAADFPAIEEVTSHSE